MIRRLALALFPLGLTLLFGWLLMEGSLSFGGGDKDIFLVLPPLVWSVLYVASSGLFWWRGATIRRAAKVSALAATTILAVAWLILFAVAWLKFG